MWAPRKKLNACVECNSTEYKHHANGRCEKCHNAKMRVVSADQRKEYLKEYYQRNKDILMGKMKQQYQKRKGSPEYLRGLDQTAMKKRVKNAIAGRSKKKQAGVVYVCECCGTRVTTPYTSKYIQDNAREFKKFKLLVIERHQNGM